MVYTLYIYFKTITHYSIGCRTFLKYLDGAQLRENVAIITNGGNLISTFTNNISDVIQSLYVVKL